MANVLVGSKLPNGLEIEFKDGKKLILKGINSSLIIGATYGITEVDSDLWASWAADNSDFPPLKNKSIFVAKNNSDAKSIASELKDVQTGLEPMSQDGKDYRAAGVKTAEA